MPRSPVVKISVKRVPDSILPARVTAYRRDGSAIYAGGKFVKTALITLFGLMTGERLFPRQISNLIEKRHIKVPKVIWEVL